MGIDTGGGVGIETDVKYSTINNFINHGSLF